MSSAKEELFVSTTKTVYNEISRAQTRSDYFSQSLIVQLKRAQLEVKVCGKTCGLSSSDMRNESNMVTYSLTLCSRVLLEKLNFSQPVK